jgi:hypothetical protein
VSQSFFQQIRQVLSEERFEAYSHAAKDPDSEKLARYLWNIALCRALYPTLQGLEIALRNALHRSISDLHGTEKWFEKRYGVVKGDSGKGRVGNALRRVQQSGNPMTPGRVVAELSFGFWASLLNRRYNQVLWPQLLKPTFPHMPRKIRTQKFVRRRIERVRKLRNRVFHHEPIWHWSDLKDQHAQTLEAIGWICPDWRYTVDTIDHFPKVHADGLKPFKSDVARAVSNHKN